MVYKIALSISLMAFPFGLYAQTADDYFQGGAQSYIQAEKEKAKQEVFTGLQKFPTDPKLNGMAGLLKKQEEEKQKQEQQQQQQQDQKDQSKEQQKQDSQSQKNDQKQDSSEQKQQAKSDEEKKQQEAKQAQEKKDQQEKDQQQAKQSSGKPDDKSDDKDGEKTYAVGQMTPEQAQQLLDTQKNEEKLLPVKPTGKPVDRSKPLRDW